MKLSSKEMAELAQTSLRNLQWWDERRIAPGAREKGRKVYRYQEAATVLLVSALRARKVNLGRVRHVLSQIGPDWTRKLDRFQVLLLSARDSVTLTARVDAAYFASAILDPFVCIDLEDLVQVLGPEEEKRHRPSVCLISAALEE